MITHFTSDQHYQHRNIIAHAERPFEDLDEMDRELEARYRSIVRDSDVVLWAGDVSFGDERARRVGSRIHVGVDAWDYAPVPIGEVERLVGAAERRVVSNDSV